MIQLTENQIDRALGKVEEGLKKYVALQDTLQKVDVSKDRDYQKRFNHFYRVRRNSSWQSVFYTLLQRNKETGITFPEALNVLKENTGRLEASFASKLVATVHPDKPVIDKFVLENADLKLPYSSSKNRQGKIVLIFNKLHEKFKDFLKTDNGKYLITEFKNQFPNENITEIKMADLVLWQTR